MPQADEEFLATCDLPSTPDAARIALIVRRAVAKYGLVDPLYVRAADRYPDELVVLPQWDSLDWMQVIFELEQELNTPLDEQALFSRLSHPGAVKQLVSEVYAQLQKQKAG